MRLQLLLLSLPSWKECEAVRAEDMSGGGVWARRANAVSGAEPTSTRTAGAKTEGSAEAKTRGAIGEGDRRRREEV